MLNIIHRRQNWCNFRVSVQFSHWLYPSPEITTIVRNHQSSSNKSRHLPSLVLETVELKYPCMRSMILVDWREIHLLFVTISFPLNESSESLSAWHGYKVMPRAFLNQHKNVCPIRHPFNQRRTTSTRSSYCSRVQMMLLWPISTNLSSDRISLTRRWQSVRNDSTDLLKFVSNRMAKDLSVIDCWIMLNPALLVHRLMMYY